MRHTNRLVFWLFHLSGGFTLITVFVSLFRILTQKQPEFNVTSVLAIELLCFLTATVLLCENKPMNSYLVFIMLYLFLCSGILYIPFDFLSYTEHFFLVSIGLISFLSWLNALIFYLLNYNR